MTPLLSKSAKSAPKSKSAKSVAKALPPPRSEPQVDEGDTHRGRERRPSDKVAAQRKFVHYHSFFNF